MLSQKHFEVMKDVLNGGTVYGYVEAKLLREVQRYDPELIHIIDNMEELERITGETYSGVERLPYFGAILTDRGKKLLKEKNVKLK